MMKNDGWKITFLLGWLIFRGYVKLPGGITEPSTNDRILSGFNHHHESFGQDAFGLWPLRLHAWGRMVENRSKSQTLKCGGVPKNRSCSPFSFGHLVLSFELVSWKYTRISFIFHLILRLGHQSTEVLNFWIQRELLLILTSYKHHFLGFIHWRVTPTRGHWYESNPNNAFFQGKFLQ